MGAREKSGKFRPVGTIAPLPQNTFRRDRLNIPLRGRPVPAAIAR